MKPLLLTLAALLLSTIALPSDADAACGRGLGLLRGGVCAVGSGVVSVEKALQPGRLVKAIAVGRGHAVSRRVARRQARRGR